MSLQPLVYLGAVALLAACASGADPAPSGSPAPSDRTTEEEATFSRRQVEAGRSTFRARCTECHASADFRSPRFRDVWGRRTAGSLFGLIRNTMPETAPGTLSAKEAAGLVSYILGMNGVQAGAVDLPSDRAVLDGMSLAPLRTAGDG